MPAHKNLRRFASFTHESVERFIEELLDVAELVADPAPVFVYPRDPADAHYIDLAVATGSKLIVSFDNDLLDLTNDANNEGKMLRLTQPEFIVLTPPQFLDLLHRNSAR